jgi:hypothetical protein
MRRHCTFVPPHVLEALAVSGCPHLQAHAAAALAADTVLRTGSVLRRGLLQPDAGTDRPGLTAGSPDAPRRSVYDATETATLPGTLVRGEATPPPAAGR